MVMSQTEIAHGQYPVLASHGLLSSTPQQSHQLLMWRRRQIRAQPRHYCLTALCTTTSTRNSTPTLQTSTTPQRPASDPHCRRNPANTATALCIPTTAALPIASPLRLTHQTQWQPKCKHNTPAPSWSPRLSMYASSFMARATAHPLPLRCRSHYHCCTYTSRSCTFGVHTSHVNMHSSSPVNVCLQLDGQGHHQQTTKRLAHEVHGPATITAVQLSLDQTLCRNKKPHIMVTR